MIESKLVRTDWDKRVFGFDTYEITQLDGETIQFSNHNPGHYTFRCDPLKSPKELLAANGFYYCDTLVEVSSQKFNPCDSQLEEALVSQDYDNSELIAICDNNTFAHGRFHKDFNIDKQLADARYMQWLNQLLDGKLVHVLKCKNISTGFIGVKENKILLQAMNSKFRGQGLGKYLLSKVCLGLFEHYDEIIATIPPSNVASMNLYLSVGFRFKTSLDIYHKFVQNR